MEDRVIFAEYLENDPDDVNNLQVFVTDSIDHVVMDTLIPGQGYAGFAASKTGPAQVTILPGRFYLGGSVFALKTPTVYDFISSLPVAAKKIVSVAIWGQEVDTNIQERNFLIAATSTPQNPIYAPQAVAMTHSRITNIGTTASAEGPDPAPPILASSVMAIATIVLTPTGVQSVVNVTTNQVPNLQNVNSRMKDLETWEATAGPELISIASDIQRLSNLLAELGSIGSQRLISRMLIRLADLDAHDGIPTAAADSQTDLYLTTDLSDTANVLYSAKVMEGIRLPDAAANDVSLQIFNPLDPNAMIQNGVLFPAYDSDLRQAIGPVTGSVQVSAYTFTTQILTQLTMSRQRVRYGTPYIDCTNTAFWHSGQYNPATHTLTVGTDTYDVSFLNSPTLDLNHEYVRLTQFWTDTYAEPYWQYITVPTTLSGTQVGETFPISQDLWVTAIGIYFSKLDASGPVTLAICRCFDTGQPDMSRVVAQSTLSYSSLKLAPAETSFPIQPTYLQSGKRYAVVLLTGANHFIATCDANAYPQGTFFALTAGGYAQVDLTRHLAFNLYAAKFRQPLVSIQLANLQLSGGMTGIDILAGVIAPASTKLTYEIQLGGIWTPLSGDTVADLNAGGNLPPNVPIRATFAGTPDIMPCLSLVDSHVHVERPALAYTHISAARTPPSTTQIRVIQRYEGFNSAFHTAAVKLLTGAGFVTVNNPASFTDQVADGGALERTYVFNLGGAVTAFKVESLGTTSTALATFLAAWRKDYVL